MCYHACHSHRCTSAFTAQLFCRHNSIRLRTCLVSPSNAIHSKLLFILPQSHSYITCLASLHRGSKGILHPQPWKLGDHHMWHAQILQTAACLSKRPPIPCPFILHTPLPPPHHHHHVTSITSPQCDHYQLHPTLSSTSTAAVKVHIAQIQSHEQATNTTKHKANHKRDHHLRRPSNCSRCCKAVYRKRSKQYKAAEPEYTSAEDKTSPHTQHQCCMLILPSQPGMPPWVTAVACSCVTTRVVVYKP